MPRREVEVLALTLCDLVLALKLGWEKAVLLLAIAVTHSSVRTTASGKRPRPDDPDWLEGCASAYALAAYDAHALARELSRGAEKLLRLLARLRAKGAGRVVELLLAEVTARAAGLSDRAGRGLFERLLALGAVRELSGRPSFRLYGL